MFKIATSTIPDSKNLFYKQLRQRQSEGDISGPFKHKHHTSIERIIPALSKSGSVAGNL